MFGLKNSFKLNGRCEKITKRLVKTAKIGVGVLVGLSVRMFKKMSSRAKVMKKYIKIQK